MWGIMPEMVVTNRLRAFRESCIPPVALPPLAEAAGVDLSTLYRIEHGQAVMQDTLNRILDGFTRLGVAVQVSDLLVYTPTPPEEGS